MILNCLKSLLLMVVLASLTSSCQKEEEPFVCNNNTVITEEGEKKCGVSKVTGYSATANTEEFRMQVEGGYQVRLMNLNGLFEEGKSYAPYELSFTGLNKHLSNTITIKKIDRTNRKLSATFVFENEREYNSQAFNRRTEGTITDITF